MGKRERERDKKSYMHVQTVLDCCWGLIEVGCSETIIGGNFVVVKTLCVGIAEVVEIAFVVTSAAVVVVAVVVVVDGVISVNKSLKVDDDGGGALVISSTSKASMLKRESNDPSSPYSSPLTRRKRQS